MEMPKRDDLVEIKKELNHMLDFLPRTDTNTVVVRCLAEVKKARIRPLSHTYVLDFPSSLGGSHTDAAKIQRYQTHLRHLLFHNGFDTFNSAEICLPFPSLPSSQRGQSAEPPMIIALLIVFSVFFSTHVPPLPPPLSNDGLLMDHGAVLQIGRIGAQKHPLEHPAMHEGRGRPRGFGRAASIEDGRHGGFAAGQFEDEQEEEGGHHGEEGGHLDLVPGCHVVFDLFDQCAVGVVQ